MFMKGPVGDSSYSLRYLLPVCSVLVSRQLTPAAVPLDLSGCWLPERSDMLCIRRPRRLCLLVSSDDCVAGRITFVEKTIRMMQKRIDPLAASCAHEAVFGLAMYFTAYDDWAGGRPAYVPPAWRIALNAGASRQVSTTPAETTTARHMRTTGSRCRP